MVIRKNRSNVTFEFTPEEAAKGVSVVGTFNGWDPEQGRMKKNWGGGTFRKRIQLEPGTHEYRFVADGEWRCDPDNQDTVPNEHGSVNSVLRLE